MKAASSTTDLPPAAFRLEELLVEPLSGLVKGPRETVRLEPRVMAVLSVLARSPGTLVTRQALLKEIWPGGDIYDEALTQCVYQLRQQLVSAGGTDRYRALVSTVPKRGYLLKGQVAPVAPDTVTATAPPPGRRRIMAFVAIGVVSAATAVLTWNAWRPDPRTETPRAGPATIAVLPFLPLLEEQSNPALGHGMADTLITQLGSSPQLVVRPMSSVRHFTAQDRDLLGAARMLGADTVVDGSIQQSDGLLRVTARLLHVADGTTLWAGTFEEPFTHIFTVQDAISARIAAALALQLAPAGDTDKPPGGTDNTEAYDRYIRGRYNLAQLTHSGLRAAVALFDEAVALDPGYAQAWLGLANAHFRIPLQAEDPLVHYPLARRAALRALEIDPNLAEGHAFLGWIAHWHDWDWAAAERHFLHAIELDPNDTEAHLGYAHLLSNTGRPEQAIAEVQRAREISPLLLPAAALEGGFLLRAGRVTEALQRLEQAVQVAPDFWFTRMTLSSAYRLAGRTDEALEQLRLAGRLNDDTTWAMAHEIGILVSMGWREEAEAVLARMQQRSREEYVPPYHFAVAYRNLGELDTSWAWLQKAHAARDPKMAFLAGGEWQVLADQPGFAALMQAMNFPPVE